MPRAFVADGDGCRVVTAATTGAAKREAARIAKRRECRDEEECEYAAKIEKAFSRPSRSEVRARPWAYA